jgi:hypothetical protein
MIVVTILLFLMLIGLFISGYFVVTGKKIPDWVYFWKTPEPDKKPDERIKGAPEPDKKPDERIKGAPEPQTQALGHCDFEGEDLYSKKVYTYDGKLVPVDMSPIKCSTCNQYVYKTDDGCVNYNFDFNENINEDDSALIDTFCDPKHPERKNYCVEPKGVCTPSLAPSKKCPF